MQRLSRALIRDHAGLPAVIPHGPLAALPERIVQFGCGAFLRAFSAWMVDILNERGLFARGIVAVQSTDRGTVQAINDQDGLYTVLLRGIKGGRLVEHRRMVTAIGRGLDASRQWPELAILFRNPELRWAISNTTEAGIAWLPEDYCPASCPKSFPAKVAALLFERFQGFEGDPAKGLVFLPCELIERNGETLRQMVLRHAEAWNLGHDFSRWVEAHNRFLNTLVDRIVTGYPRDEAAAWSEKLGYEDTLLVAGEIFHFWVIEGPPELAAEFPLHRAGLNVVWTGDLAPYRVRKVRILNGAHTACVPAAFQAGLDTVREMIEDPLLRQFVRKTVFDEILPTVGLAAEEKTAYAEAVLERFGNPFVRHELLSIALNCVSKWRVRVLPSLLDFLRQSGRLPPLLSFSLAALIHFHRPAGSEAGHHGLRGERQYPLRDELPVLALFENAWRDFHEDGSARRLVTRVLAEETLWMTDLSLVSGLADAVTGGLIAIMGQGIRGAISAVCEKELP